MQENRILKINIHQGILRQVIFTSFNISVFITLLLNGFFVYFSHQLPIELKIIGSGILTTAILIVLTYKVDNQTLISLFKRILRFVKTNKNVRY